MNVASVLKSVTGLGLPEASVRFAAAGVPVFPCVPGGKRPLTGHGFHDATTDAVQIRSWWERWPHANLAIPTGTSSGVDVVDVDRRTGGDGFAAFGRARRAGLAAGWVALVRTPSGGMHAYYPAGPGRPQASWQAAAAHVDFRGAGGYVVVPPSTVTGEHGRGSYVFVAGPDPLVRPVDAAGLRDFLDPRPASIPHLSHDPVKRVDAERLAAWVSLRAEGERNRGLFWASCRLAEAGLSLPDMADALAPAAERVGLPSHEVAATIRSAYRHCHAGAASVSDDSSAAPRRAAVRPVGWVLS